MYKIDFLDIGRNYDINEVFTTSSLKIKSLEKPETHEEPQTTKKPKKERTPEEQKKILEFLNYIHTEATKPPSPTTGKTTSEKILAINGLSKNKSKQIYEILGKIV